MRLLGRVADPVLPGFVVFPVALLGKEAPLTGDELRFLCITSAVRVHTVHAAPSNAVAAETGSGVLSGVWLSAQRSGGTKCVRCWHLTQDVGADTAHPELCGRCAGNRAGRPEGRQQV